MRTLFRTAIAMVLVVVPAAALTGCDVLAPTRNADGHIAHTMMLSATDMVVDDCFTFTNPSDVSQAQVTPCNQPHALRVIGQGRLSEERVALDGGLQTALAAACKNDFAAFRASHPGIRKLQFIVSTRQQGGETVTLYSCVSTDRVGAA
ncbi:MAG: hypothetical protein EPN91_10140 [Salinibacterium sp.]|nr:MAG: hypothetical protein EPN91_10140 [Salinibacterium sp.]